MSIVTPQQAASGISEIVPFVWEKIASLSKEKWASKSLISAYAFELRTNLDIFDALNLDALKDIHVADPVFRNLLGRLHTDVAASILFSPDHSSYRRFLQKLKRHLRPEDTFDAEDENSGKSVNERIGTGLAALSFSVCKLEVIRSLSATADPESPLFLKYRPDTRMKNIKKSLLLLWGCVNKMNRGEDRQP